MEFVKSIWPVGCVLWCHVPLQREPDGRRSRGGRMTQDSMVWVILWITLRGLSDFVVRPHWLVVIVFGQWYVEAYCSISAVHCNPDRSIRSPRMCFQASARDSLAARRLRIALTYESAARRLLTWAMVRMGHSSRSYAQSPYSGAPPMGASAGRRGHSQGHCRAASTASSSSSSTSTTTTTTTTTVVRIGSVPCRCKYSWASVSLACIGRCLPVVQASCWIRFKSLTVLGFIGYRSTNISGMWHVMTMLHHKSYSCIEANWKPAYKQQHRLPITFKCLRAMMTYDMHSKQHSKWRGGLLARPHPGELAAPRLRARASWDGAQGNNYITLYIYIYMNIVSLYRVR